MLLSYAVGNGAVETLELANSTPEDREKNPEWQEFVQLATDPAVLKVAYNVGFDRVMIRDTLGLDIPPDQWRDPSVWARSLYSLKPVKQEKDPAKIKLKTACEKLGIEQEQQKSKKGKDPMKLFSKPGKIDTSRPEWQTYIEYNKQDVIALRAVTTVLYPMRPDYTEWKNGVYTEQVNDYGVTINHTLAQNVVDFIKPLDEANIEHFQQIVGPDGPTGPRSYKKLILWIKDQGVEVPQNADGKETLDKKARANLLARKNLPDKVRQALECMERASNSSLAKFKTAMDMECEDGRVHGVLLHYGAHTGRWTSNGVQVQNMKRITRNRETLDMIRNWLIKGHSDMITFAVPDPEDAVSQLGRTLFEAPEGKIFLDADFSQIEARVTQYLATLDAGKDPIKENATLQAFAAGTDVYCMTAESMYHVHVEKNGENGNLRKYGKTATLACGYQGGLGALRRMGLSEQDASDAEAQQIVYKWREANPDVVAEWKRLEKDAIQTVKEGKGGPGHGRFSLVEIANTPVLRLCLPSGRYLYFWGPVVRKEEVWGREQEGMFFSWYKGGKQSYYGGLLFENLVQATARDVLAEALLRLRAAKIPVVFHVHDEVLCEIPSTQQAIKEATEKVTKALCATPKWAPGLPLACDPYTTQYFTKD